MSKAYSHKIQLLITLSVALAALFVLYVVFRRYGSLTATIFIYMFLFSVLISYYVPEVFIGFFLQWSYIYIHLPVSRPESTKWLVACTFFYCDFLFVSTGLPRKLANKNRTGFY